MKKITLLLLGSVFAFSFAHAQHHTTQFGKFAFGASVGLLPSYAMDDAETHVPPINVRAGVRLSQRFTLSSFLGYTDVTSAPKLFNDGYSTVINNKTLLLGLRSEMHKEITDRVEMYGGILLGWSHSQRMEKDAVTGIEMKRDANTPTPYNPNAPNAQMLYAGFVGATYFVDDKLGVFSEIGYGISLLSVGVMMKM